MDQLINHLFDKAFPHALRPATERALKNTALVLGLTNALASCAAQPEWVMGN
jgi:hypothetical protein